MLIARRYCLAFLCICLPISSAWPLDRLGHYHALVIGNNDYRHFRPLQTAVADARAVANVLETRYGFTVTTLINADKTTILRRLNRFKAELGAADNLLLYFAGHGSIEKPHDIGFWLPVDAEPDDDTNWLANAEITRRFLGMAAKHVLVVADSCYSGTLLRDGARKAASGSARQEWLDRVARQRARVALTSGSLEPVEDGGGGQHSVFAKTFLELLISNTEIIDGQTLFQRLRRRVMAASEQTPLYSTLRKAGHEGGDFIFRPLPQFQQPETPLTPAQSTSPSTAEVASWMAAAQLNSKAGYQTYLEQFPTGIFAELARERMQPSSPDFVFSLTTAAKQKFNTFITAQPPKSGGNGQWIGHGWSTFAQNDPSDPLGYCRAFNLQFVVRDGRVAAKIWNNAVMYYVDGEIRQNGELNFPNDPEVAGPVLRGTLENGRWHMASCQGTFRSYRLP